MSFDLSRRYALIESSAFVYSVAAKISSNCACGRGRAAVREWLCAAAVLCAPAAVGTPHLLLEDFILR